MAGGWSRDGSVQEQIDASVEDEIERARSQLTVGESAAKCDECCAPIPEARRKAIPGVRLCIDCQSAHEKRNTRASGINRRGSKDSQLR
ncbi:DksA/TraR family C4-type zinc finger protein [Marinobacter adhaerens]|uniref:DksA/TraR family C4-type zinc finger protein n=2 Tax=Marinobacter adhaerens TaxID=1033846 RepID=A0ABX8ICT2_9GAMM|nr:DksA/TraR family C4-type zinc finger protein [Marinobacter adhaerens]ADP97459.1 protein containing zinc finger, DksA/TraR C4-type domain [Marinobacter adhaerens HP15]MBW4978589.1 DksA/TraR family C4-type zinc finger protein [Marinobacter adhaerens]QWV11540.1 DksA/TraR family C4-type zinc finger protein [Marinobacter adhaerens]